MASEKRRQQKLRHEISELSSLIRTLHTTSTQDIVPHLTGSFLPPSTSPSRLSSPRKLTSRALEPSRLSPQNIGEALEPRDLPEYGSDDVSDYLNHSSSRSKSDVSDTGFEFGRDSSSSRVWTRWPLLQTDAYKPEWTLQDEVQSIAEVTARKWVTRYAANGHDSSSPKAQMMHSPSNDTGSDSEEESHAVRPLPEEQIVTKGALNGLTLESVNLLSHIFATLAAHRPAVDPSLQNRLKSMDWKSVVKILGASGIVNPRILQAAEKKMESIYGESDGETPNRLEPERGSKRKLKELEASLGSRMDFLHFTTEPQSRKRVRRSKRHQENKSEEAPP